MSKRFEQLLREHRRPDGSEWTGAELEKVTGGVVSRSYVSNLRKGRIGNPGLDKLGAVAEAMGFPPGLWFADEEDFAVEALAATLRDPTARAILEEVAKLGRRDRRLLLGVARGISTSPGSGKEPGA